MFSVNTTPEKFEIATITSHFGFVTRAGKSRDYRDVIVFEKLRSLKIFPVHSKTLSRRFQTSPI